MTGQIGLALDLGAQRLKSLELMARGSHFTVAQEVEILGKEQSTMSSTVEMQEAARRAREAGKAKMEASKPYGSRSSNPGRNEDWNNKGGKKGQEKGKGQKGDGKKGDRDKQKGQRRSESEAG